MDRYRCQKEVYEIRVKGHLVPFWSEMFDGMQITLAQDGETTFTGAVADQAALHGLLAMIRDFNLILISVNRVDDAG
ncbi:MAG TPA: hypothetical protein VLA49_20720 [Anaerolineales bacterium]|nr:hypothetical protein [Anaerolineales bacterium]